MRVLRTLMFVAGAAFLLLLVANNLYGLYLIRDEPVFALRLPSALFWSGSFLILALACVLGAFMKPKEFREVFKEAPVRRAAWLDELNAPPKDEG